MTINREATIRWKGYDPADLKPKSNKRVWANCDKCGNGRWVAKCDYTDLCHNCSINTREYRDRHSKRMIEKYKDQNERDEQSKTMRQYHIDHPEESKILKSYWVEYWSIQANRDAAAKRMVERFSDQLERDKQSERIKNSGAHKASFEKTIGGNDIINHHYIYDHSNPEKYTMKVTRSKHGQIHGWMRKSGIKVPHINITEENKNIFRGVHNDQ